MCDLSNLRLIFLVLEKMILLKIELMIEIMINCKKIITTSNYDDDDLIIITKKKNRQNTSAKK